MPQSELVVLGSLSSIAFHNSQNKPCKTFSALLNIVQKVLSPCYFMHIVKEKFKSDKLAVTTDKI